MTLQEAKALKHGDVIIYNENKSRWRVNGKTKLWKTRPNEIRIPLKHGLYDYGYLTHRDLDCFSLEVV